jgi:AcrR family transcriptional regulator
MLTRRAPSVRRAPRRGGDLRAAILRAARRLYLAHGSDGVTARRVARAIGTSPTAIYLHFRGLGDILEHLRMEGHELLASYLTAVDATLPALQRLREMGRAYFRFGVEHPGYFDLMFQGRPGMRRRREAVQREMFTLLILRDVVQAGMARRELRSDLDPTVVTNALWAEIHGVTALMTAGLLVETSAGHADDVRDAALDGALAWLAPPGRTERR